MNSNQRSQGNNQSDNAGNEKSVSSSRGGTVDKELANAPSQQSQQSGKPGAQQQGSQQQGSQQQGSQQQGSQQQGAQQQGSRQQGSQQQGRTPGSQQSTDRTGSQTGTGQQNAQPGVHESNDLAGGMPRSPGGNRMSADEPMDDDTGLSNRQSEIDEGSRQAQQSNVGRRSDGTPD